MRSRRRPGPRVRYRCCGCEFEFTPPEPGAAACPRCQSVGGHDPVDVYEASHDRIGGREASHDWVGVCRDGGDIDGG